MTLREKHAIYDKNIRFLLISMINLGLWALNSDVDKNFRLEIKAILSVVWIK